jgi:Tol biopolymer transport system component
VNPRSGAIIGQPHKIYRLPRSKLVEPSASADGRRLAFIALKTTQRAEILELGRVGGARAERPVTEFDWSTISGVWSVDGKRLFFAANRSGNDYDIYSKDLESGKQEPFLATEEDEYPSRLTPGGSELLCVQTIRAHSSQKKRRLLAVPVAGGPSRILADSVEGFPGLVCTVAPDTLCLIGQQVGEEVVLRKLDLQRGIGKEMFRIKAGPQLSLDLSPDGRLIAVVDGQVGKSIRLLDVATGSERVVPNKFTGMIQRVRWSRDGRWLYVSGMVGTPYYWLRRVGLDGRDEMLWKSGSDPIRWASDPSPSPDGQRVAFTVVEFGADMWMIEGF